MAKLVVAGSGGLPISSRIRPNHCFNTTVLTQNHAGPRWFAITTTSATSATTIVDSWSSTIDTSDPSAHTTITSLVVIGGRSDDGSIDDRTLYYTGWFKI